jgi:hypothetical protein
MALVARGIAVAGNAGKFALVDRNPLNLNFPLWMAIAMPAFEAEQSNALATSPFSRCLVRSGRAIVEAMPVPLSCRCQAFAETVTIVLRVAEIPRVDVSDAPDMHAVTVGVDGTLVAGGGRPYTTRRGRGLPRTAVPPG